MAKRRLHPATLQTALSQLRAAGRQLVALLPGRRPAWITLELSGAYPARVKRRGLFGLPVPPELGWSEPSLEELQRDLDSLADAPWLDGVLLRVSDLQVDLATAYALRRGLSALRQAGKQTVAWLPQLDWTSYYVAAAADSVVAPVGADVRLYGLGISVTFLRDALAKLGARFEKLAIGKYKSAFDELVRQRMSESQREQLEALLESFERTYMSDVASDRGLAPDQLRLAIDEGVSSAARAQELGLIDRVGYEDEIVAAGSRSVGDSARFLGARRGPLLAKRIAVVSLQGVIAMGRSRRSPLGMLSLGDGIAGADTIVQSLRAAAQDDRTGAVVLVVHSPGGSALASDLIWREVERVRQRKPVVAVAGGLAASGGYYVMVAANCIIAAPTTITGSIGVLTGKLVLDDLYERWGLHAEQLRRGRYALMFDPATPLTDEERELLARSNEQTYQRFVSRVAAGRQLSAQQVDELGGGRLWSGADAARHGLVDELGDVQTAIERAATLAGLPAGAATWNVRAPTELVLPTAADPSTMQRTLGQLLSEHTLLLEPTGFTVR